MKNKILLLYKSKTGFTKRYAEIIAKETHAVLMDYKKASPKIMSGFDTVIFGSRAHVGMIDGYKKIRQMFLKSGAKHFVLFVTGATPNNSKEVETFWQQNLSADELRNLPHFYMQSGLCYEKMPCLDRLMMKGFCSMMQKKKNKTEQDKTIEQMITGSYDISSDEYTKPLLDYVRENLS